MESMPSSHTKDAETKKYLSERPLDEQEYIALDSDSREFIIVEGARNEFTVTKQLLERSGPFVEVGGPTPPDLYYLVPVEPSEGAKKNFESWKSLYDSCDVVMGDKKKKLWTSNIANGVPNFNKDNPVEIVGSVDLIADGSQLPAKKNSLGAVFVNCLGKSSFDDARDFAQEKLGIQAIRYMKPHEIYDFYTNNSTEFKGLRKGKSVKADNVYTEKLIEMTLEIRRSVIKEAWELLEAGGVLVWEGGKKDDISFAVETGFVVAQYLIEGASRYNYIFVKDN